MLPHHIGSLRGYVFCKDSLGLCLQLSIGGLLGVLVPLASFPEQYILFTVLLAQEVFKELKPHCGQERKRTIRNYAYNIYCFTTASDLFNVCILPHKRRWFTLFGTTRASNKLPTPFSRVIFLTGIVQYSVE